MIFTASPCGSTNFWMSHQRMPACTRIVFSAGENATTLFSRRMSRCRLPGLAVWPPMLKWPPPTETGTVRAPDGVLHLLDAWSASRSPTPAPG